MFLHTVNPGQGVDTRCADNTILLRRDLHKMWDDHKFAIVPKAGKWVVHVLWNSSVVEIQERYHNLELQPLAGVSRHFFLCRFALAVFSNSPFLSQRVPRKLILVDYEGLAEVQVREMAPDEYQRKFSTLSTRANNRSQSPKKRSRSAPRNEVDDGSVLEEPDSEDHDEEEEEDRELPERAGVQAHVGSGDEHQGAVTFYGHRRGRRVRQGSRGPIETIINNCSAIWLRVLYCPIARSVCQLQIGQDLQLFEKWHERDNAAEHSDELADMVNRDPVLLGQCVKVPSVGPEFEKPH
ncbi:uncharacterized protein N7446_010530 [Penicillium canescens]|uniref:uncharacterized protein n=1 Tax=Penicillium canescens TaxID=5083 RepID=UPI0026DF81B6|nr:uncharacterized protein N7446_010530 [Penicillium canescens]KAJ6050421.1 hypothetical protein N7446_010530 [Penicillium canescens]KAJ6064725.1 hypothetical protein N7444_000378 [Penicillium canescens]